MRVDLQKKGMDALFNRPWKAELFRFVLEKGEVTSRGAYEWMRLRHPGEYGGCRVNMVVFLKEVSELGMLEVRKVVRRGGYQYVFSVPPYGGANGFYQVAERRVAAWLQELYDDLNGVVD